MSRLGFDLTWLGHSAFFLDAEPEGPGILIDPWLDNPKAPVNATELANRAKLILVTHGHSDHIGGTVAAIAQREGGATVILVTRSHGGDRHCRAYRRRQQLIGFNKGGSASAEGVTVTLLQAFHSSSLSSPDGRARSIGDPCGMVIELPNGTVIYNTGDTCVFGDMALIADLYKPSILMLPIGDFYTMGPKQAARACQLVNPQWIVPHHYGTFPGLTGTPEALRELLPPALRDRVLDPKPGETIR